MSGLGPEGIPAWRLPLIAAALITPAAVGFLLVGPALGLALGAATAVALVVLAARATPDEPFDVAPGAPGGREQVVVVLSAAIESEADADRIPGLIDDGGADVYVVSPAADRRLDRWLSATDDARAHAEQRLDLVLRAFDVARRVGSVRGEIGDRDPVRATEDALRSHRANRVVLLAEGSEPAEGLAELRRRLPDGVSVVSIQPTG